MQRHLIKLSWYPLSGERGPGAAAMPHILPQRKVSGPLQTCSRQLLEDIQRERREDRRGVAQVPIGLRHRVSDLYKSGNTPVAAAQEAVGHHEVSFYWGLSLMSTPYSAWMSGSLRNTLHYRMLDHHRGANASAP